MATDAKDLHSDEHSLSGSDAELAAGRIGDPETKTDPFPATIVDPPQQSAPSAAEKITEQLAEITANGTKKVMAPLFPPPKGKNKKKKMKKKIEPVAPANVPQTVNTTTYHIQHDLVIRGVPLSPIGALQGFGIEGCSAAGELKKRKNAPPEGSRLYLPANGVCLLQADWYPRGEDVGACGKSIQDHSIDADYVFDVVNGEHYWRLECPKK